MGELLDNLKESKGTDHGAFVLRKAILHRAKELYSFLASEGILHDFTNDFMRVFPPIESLEELTFKYKFTSYMVDKLKEFMEK